jgi:cation diffusion facilitator CzcD-associated flavoprotein CzcO
MTDKFDAIVVGGGHNGLVCSTLLAQSGKQVLLLEANDQVGGAAVTREFADGYAVGNTRVCRWLRGVSLCAPALQPAAQRKEGIEAEPRAYVREHDHNRARR